MVIYPLDNLNFYEILQPERVKRISIVNLRFLSRNL